METFTRFLYEFLGQFFSGIISILKGFGTGFKQILDIKSYQYVIDTYKDDLSMSEWVLVIRKTGTLDWVLKPVNVVLNFYAQGRAEISSRGTVHIGKITIQRKGGDNGRETANMLQFKCDPTELFLI